MASVVSDVTTLVEAASAVQESAQDSGLDAAPTANLERELAAFRLIEAWRTHGHRVARVNPIQETPSSIAELELSSFGLSPVDLSETFYAARFLGLPPSPLSTLLDHLNRIYAGPVGVELAQLQNPAERSFIESRIENLRGEYAVGAEDKKFILRRLTESEAGLAIRRTGSDTPETIRFGQSGEVFELVEHLRRSHAGFLAGTSPLSAAEAALSVRVCFAAEEAARTGTVVRIA